MKQKYLTIKDIQINETTNKEMIKDLEIGDIDDIVKKSKSISYSVLNKRIAYYENIMSKSTDESHFVIKTPGKKIRVEKKLFNSLLNRVRKESIPISKKRSEGNPQYKALEDEKNFILGYDLTSSLSGKRQTRVSVKNNSGSNYKNQAEMIYSAGTSSNNKKFNVTIDRKKTHFIKYDGAEKNGNLLELKNYSSKSFSGGKQIPYGEFMAPEKTGDYSKIKKKVSKDNPNLSAGKIESKTIEVINKGLSIIQGQINSGLISIINSELTGNKDNFLVFMKDKKKISYKHLTSKIVLGTRGGELKNPSLKKDGTARKGSTIVDKMGTKLLRFIVYLVPKVPTSFDSNLEDVTRSFVKMLPAPNKTTSESVESTLDDFLKEMTSV